MGLHPDFLPTPAPDDGQEAWSKAQLTEMNSAFIQAMGRERLAEKPSRSKEVLVTSSPATSEMATAEDNVRTDPRIRLDRPQDDQPPADANAIMREIVERENAALRIENKQLRSVVRSIVRTATPYAVSNKR